MVLARPHDPERWNTVRRDPGCVTLALSHHETFVPANVLTAALNGLQREPSGRISDQRILSHAIDIARTAESLAQSRSGVDLERAWIAGLLAPLGWLAIAATDADALSRCLSDQAFRHDPFGVQQRHWGLDASGIARRLAWRWHLPTWLTSIIGHLNLPLSTAQHFGADGELFAIVQLAVAICDAKPDGLMLAPAIDVQELRHRLGLNRDALPRFESPPEPLTFVDPYTQPLLIELLSSRSVETPAVEPLEAEIDRLHQALCEQRMSEETRLRDAKLSALAEFAAGASHEINNPLAVISGHGQYLLAREEDAARQSALQAIIRQTHRIHSILSELMQFARPLPPQKQPLDIRAVVAGVLHDLRDSAEAKRIRIDYSDSECALPLVGDARQVSLALTCLVRNAIEAALADGWVHVRLEKSVSDRLDVVIEDSGTGPNLEQREHLFDPFYSGRSAGRGRGLGLPTAWRLAHEHGGDVSFVPLADGPTRFVLSLPLAEENATRQAA